VLAGGLPPLSGPPVTIGHDRKVHREVSLLSFESLLRSLNFECREQALLGMWRQVDGEALAEIVPGNLPQLDVCIHWGMENGTYGIEIVGQWNNPTHAAAELPLLLVASYYRRSVISSAA